MDKIIQLINMRKDQLDLLLHAQQRERDEFQEQLEKRMNAHKMELDKMVRAQKDEMDMFVSQLQLQGKHKVLTLNSKKNKIILYIYIYKLKVLCQWGFHYSMEYGF